MPEEASPGLLAAPRPSGTGVRGTTAGTEVHHHAVVLQPDSGSVGAGSAGVLHCLGVAPGHWLGAEQSDGRRHPQAHPGLGRLPCCSMQENLLLIDETGDGLHGKESSPATSLGKRWVSQVFNKKPGKDLATAFTGKQEHTRTVTVKGKVGI